MAVIDDPITSDKAGVNSDSELKVALSKDTAKAGYAVMVGESHNGLSGLATVRRAGRVSIEKRLGVGMDLPLWEDFFSHATLNTRKYQNTLTTMTTTLSGGLLTMNAGASVATTVGDLLRTYKSFQTYGDHQTKIHAWFTLAIVPQANNVIMIGIGIPGTATVTSTDGIFMVLDSTGSLSLHAYYNNATPTASAPVTFTWVPGRLYHLEIVLHRDRAEMYIDDVLLAVIDRASANAAGALSLSQSGHLIAHLVNRGATVAAQKLILAGWHVSVQDGDMSKPWGAIRTANGDNALSAPDASAVAQLANNANSAAPASATLSNTAAGYTTLGGNFQFAAVAGAETDFALFAYQVPVGSAAAPGKSFVVAGVSIDAFNLGAAVATTATMLNWSLGVGATAVSLATADGAATRAAHRVTLGAQTFPVGAAIGARADRAISEDFSTAPIVVEPGTFLHVILRVPVGTATASQIIRGMVAIKGYFE